VMVSRDGPIATLNPNTIGALAPGGTAPRTAIAAGPGAGQVTDPLALAVQTAVAQALPDLAGQTSVRVTEGPAPELQLIAVRPAWVRVRAADGSVLFEGILNAGDTFAVPATEEPPTLRVGESGALYFAVNGVHHGPVGPNGTVTSNVPLLASDITATYALADLTRDADLAEFVSVAQATLQPAAEVDIVGIPAAPQD